MRPQCLSCSLDPPGKVRGGCTIDFRRFMPGITPSFLRSVGDGTATLKLHSVEGQTKAQAATATVSTDTPVPVQSS